MTMHRATWIDVMGSPYVEIAADFNADTQRVTVDAGTLHRMADAIEAAGILPDADADATTAAIRATADIDGRYDVTEAGGDWNLWQWLIAECSCGHPSHPERPCAGTGADLDPIYGIDPTEPCACTTDTTF